MDIIAEWIGYVILVSGGLTAALGIVYAATYWVTYAVNNSHRRAAATIAGKHWLEVLQKAVEDQKAAPAKPEREAGE